jgi:uncharacterized protein
MPAGRSPFRFNVADLLAEPGRRRAVAIATAVDWAVGESSVGPGFEADLTLEGGSGGVLVRGSATVEANLACHRCLTEWVEQVEVEIVEMLGLPDDPDGYDLDDDVADLETLLRDAVLLALPLAPTCRPGCLGLCSVCGGDLNTGACAGHESDLDSPFAALRELLEP